MWVDPGASWHPALRWMVGRLASFRWGKVMALLFSGRGCISGKRETYRGSWCRCGGSGLGLAVAVMEGMDFSKADADIVVFDFQTLKFARLMTSPSCQHAKKTLKISWALHQWPPT